VPEGVEGRFIDIVLKHPSVRSIRDVKTRELTPESYILKAEITLDNDYIAEQIGRTSAERISLDGPKRDRSLRRMAALVTDLIATEIAAIEADVKKVIPQAKHIDLEVAHPDKIPEDEDDEMLA
jgi:zinc transporter 9